MEFPEGWVVLEKKSLPRERYGYFRELHIYFDKSAVELSNPWFLEPPSNSNKRSFPSVKHYNFIPISWTTRFLDQFSFSVGGSRNWDFIVHLHDMVHELGRLNFDCKSKYWYNDSFKKNLWMLNGWLNAGMFLKLHHWYIYNRDGNGNANGTSKATYLQ